MKTLSIDIETYSGADIKTGGVYRYSEDPDFDILLFAYSVDEGDVHVVDMASGEQLPADVMAALTDSRVTKYAFNANFERVCISRWLAGGGGLDPGTMLPPESWRCTMVWASALGLPRSLRQVGDALKLEQGKMLEGNALIKLFCTPRDSSKDADTLIPTPKRVLPSHAPDKWKTFVDYNRRDVEVELGIRRRLEPHPLPEWVWEQYCDDQRINDRGVHVDVGFAQCAISIDNNHREDCIDQLRRITGLPNPGSVQQLKQWLASQGCELPGLAKDTVSDALRTATGDVRQVLELRQQIGRSSVKKYVAMEYAQCSDGRAHGLLQFMGAGRTGRWAGRLIQVQNLPRNYLADLDAARDVVATGDGRALGLLFGDVPDTLSQLIRTAFVPSPGNRFIVADYSAIEARVLAWLAGQQDTLDAFEAGKDLYCVTASKMFGVPVEKHGVNSDMRQLGKVATLACGYAGGLGAIKTMGGERMGMTKQEMQDTVTKWRQANEHVVQLWRDVEDAAKAAIRRGVQRQVRALGLRCANNTLFIRLPSGRELVYPGARIGTNRFGGESIEFRGVSFNGLVKEETYGGKLTENITQAVARDLLAHAIGLLERRGLKTVFHVHDEVVIDAGHDTDIDTVCALMADTPAWAAGLPLTADGYECDFYMKD